MRVIGGSVKGHRLRSLKGQSLRPTADRVKEALFNILPRDLSGFRVLDLFAGTGSLSIEALSRGAEEAVLVDSSPRAGRAIHVNLRALGFSRRSRVWIAPVMRSIHLLARRGEKFNLIFVDPPYGRGWIGRVLTAIAREELLDEAGVLIAEHGGKEEVGESYGPLRLQDRRRYGDTFLSFFGCRPFRLVKCDEGKSWRRPA